MFVKLTRQPTAFIGVINVSAVVAECVATGPVEVPTTLPTIFPPGKPAADLLEDLPTGGRAMAAPKAAAAFRSWLADHGLDVRSWSVDDLWYLASQDFAPAQSVTLPARNTFLSAVQKLADTRVQYDKRVRVAGELKKTTFYSFHPAVGAGNASELVPLRRAA
jgi:hypothetical protein